MRLRLSSSGKRLSRRSSRTIKRMKKTLRLLKSRKSRRNTSRKSSKKSRKSRRMKGGFNGTFLSEVYLGRPSIGFGDLEKSPQAGGARKSRRLRKSRKSKRNSRRNIRKSRGGDRLASTQDMIGQVGYNPWPTTTSVPQMGGQKKSRKSKKARKSRKSRKSRKVRGGDRMASTQHWATSSNL